MKSAFWIIKVGVYWYHIAFEHWVGHSLHHGLVGGEQSTNTLRLLQYINI
jgi:hypothetical protein